MSEREPLALRIARVRTVINKKCTKKSGYNSFAKFNYFQLDDFLPQVNEECLKEGILPMFNIKTVEDMVWDKESKDYVKEYKNVAELRVEDAYSTEFKKWETPVAEVRMGQGARNPIQELGAMHTYLKRYLYMNFLELSENDVVDATVGKDEAKDKKELPTMNMLVDFSNAYTSEQRSKIREHYKVSDDSELPRDVVKQYNARPEAKEKIKKAKEKPPLDMNEERKAFY